MPSYNASRHSPPWTPSTYYFYNKQTFFLSLGEGGGGVLVARRKLKLWGHQQLHQGQKNRLAFGWPMDPWEAITQSLCLNDHTPLCVKGLLLNLCNCNSLVQSFFGVLQQSLIDLSLSRCLISEERLKSDSIEDGLACCQSSAAFSPSICLHIKKQKRGMHCLYALRIKR